MTPFDSSIFNNLEELTRDFKDKAAVYHSNQPYPHLVIDNFLDPTYAEKILDSFPNVKDEGWIHYVHFNEKKHGLNKIELLPEPIQYAIQQLNHPEFIQRISILSGINHLLGDSMLEGGGIHQTLKGGFLNVHADYTAHPHKENWRRRVNLLIYFNKDWKEEYNGHLELWDKGMNECKQRILPIFNRCVIFNTDFDSYHGVPEILKCPKGWSRKSIALYYFTIEDTIDLKSATNYKARPTDSTYKSVMIYLDKKVLSLYNWLKGKLGINDDFVSRLLNMFNRKS